MDQSKDLSDLPYGMNSEYFDIVKPTSYFRYWYGPADDSGVVSNKMSIETIFGHKHFDFHKKCLRYWFIIGIKLLILKLQNDWYILNKMAVVAKNCN